MGITLCQSDKRQAKKGFMANQKIKFDQYKVRGKRRDYEVIVLPRKKYMWAFYDDFDRQFEIDGNVGAYRYVKYALAILINDPTKIVYLPIRGQAIGKYYQDNSYDAVLTRPELQLRRSEWVCLRRQLDRAHRMENYVLRYEPEKLCDEWAKWRENRYNYRGKNREKQEVNTMADDTVFISYWRDAYLAAHDRIVCAMREPLSEPSEPIFTDITNYPYLGWILTPASIRNMEEKARTNDQHSQRGTEG